MQKLTIAEYCRKFGTADSTVRHRIKTGKLQFEVVDGLTYVVTDDDEIGTSLGDDISVLVKVQQEEIEYLRQQLKSTCEEKDEQIRELHQLIGFAHKSIEHLTQQHQLMLESQANKVPWWRKMLPQGWGKSESKVQQGETV